MINSSSTLWVDYMRGFITLLVVAHHSSLAYTTFASFNKLGYITSTHPVVDVIRWKWMDYFQDFNDIFFMSLMFLIGGVFVMKAKFLGLIQRHQISFSNVRPEQWFYGGLYPFLCIMLINRLCLCIILRKNSPSTKRPQALFLFRKRCQP